MTFSRTFSLEFMAEALHIADILRRNNVKTVLDVGSGNGMLGHLLSAIGIKTTGTDIDCSKSMIYCIEGRSPDILETFTSKSFDAVVSQHFIEHLYPQEQYKLLLESTRIARKIVVVVTPNARYPWKPPDGHYHPDHKHMLTVGELKQMMYILRANNRIKKYRVYTINNFAYASRKYYPYIDIMIRAIGKILGKPTIVGIAWV